MASLTVVSGGYGVARRVPAVPSPVLATIIFVVTEMMYFSALVSAFTVIKSHVFGSWTPPGDIRLPMAATAFNTLVLMTSGVLVTLAGRAFANVETREKAKSYFSLTILLGSFFVIFQGYEWIKLIRYGMTMTSSIFGATFFLLIGSHGVHALAAVIAMLLVYRRMAQGKLTIAGMRAMQLFWTFVVLVWPVLYGLVYFG